MALYVLQHLLPCSFHVCPLADTRRQPTRQVQEDLNMAAKKTAKKAAPKKAAKKAPAKKAAPKKAAKKAPAKKAAKKA